MAYLFRSNSIASTSRVPFFPVVTSSPFLRRTIQYDASGRLANIHAQTDDPTTVFVRLYSFPSTAFHHISTALHLSSSETDRALPASSLLQVARIPAWQSAHGIIADWAAIGIAVKDVYLPQAKTADGKKRKNNRCFGFVECANEHHARKACVSRFALVSPSLCQVVGT